MKGFLGVCLLIFSVGCTSKRPVRVAAIIGLTEDLKADLKQELEGVDFVWDPMKASEVEQAGEKSVSNRDDKSYDVVVGGFSKWYFQNMEQGGFIPFRSPEMVTVAPFWRDEKLSFVPLMFTSFAFAHRPEFTDVPKKWSELFDPAHRDKWSGKITMVNPSKAITAEIAMYSLFRILGEGGFRGISNFNVFWTEDYKEGLDRLLSHKSDLAIISYQQFLFLNPNPGSLMLSYPEDGTLPLMSGCGILKGAKNLNAAKKVLSWIFKYKFQKHLLDDRRTHSSMASVPHDSRLRPWESEIKGVFRWTIPVQEKFRQDETKILEAIKNVAAH